jgi:hypothetical protein
MKAIKYIAIAAVALSAGLTSCKKGENDPFLSLSSRKARLTGEWTLSSSSSTSTNSFGGSSSTTTRTYNGTTETTVYTVGAGSTTSTENFTVEMAINKDGTFTRTLNNTTNQEKYEESGNWTFAGKNKTAEYKNKELVVLYVKKTVFTDLTNSSNTQTTESTSVNNGSAMVIDQLKGKEIIFISKSTYSGSSGSTNSFESSMTLTKK